MNATSFSYEYLNTRFGFNQSLSHFKLVNEIIPDLEDFYNLADILNTYLSEKRLEQEQIGPVVDALLVDKYAYQCKSLNLIRTFDEYDVICEEASSWNAVDMVMAYYHPELGVMLVNPKNEEHWKAINAMKSNELVSLYCGAFDEDLDPSTARLAIKKMSELLDKGKTSGTAGLKNGEYEFFPYEEEEEVPPVQKRVAGARPAQSEPSAPAGEPSKPAPPQKKAASSGPRRMTPMYSVPVTNELFHNGNVEAWKKVIQSYNAKYPDLEVYLYYDGERIHDIHALFKWGKVKHGSAILFAVAGENVKDIAKLQRYLRQGASPQFEAFLKFPVNVVLKLF